MFSFVHENPGYAACALKLQLMRAAQGVDSLLNRSDTAVECAHLVGCRTHHSTLHRFNILQQMVPRTTYAASQLDHALLLRKPEGISVIRQALQRRSSQEHADCNRSLRIIT